MTDYKISFVYVTIGPPGCGKGTWYKQFSNILKNHSNGLHYVSSDEIRHGIFGDESCQADNDLVFRTVHDQINGALEHKLDVFVDATHIMKEWRAYIFELAKLHDAKVIALWFDVPFFTCLKRNKMRERKVPWTVILRHFFIRDFPTYAEGFYRVWIINKKGTNPL